MIICASASIALLIVIGIYTIKSFKKNYKFEIEELVLLLVAICVNLTFMMIFKIYVFKMNIDVRNINAAVYANIVHQADVEISMKKKRT